MDHEGYAAPYAETQLTFEEFNEMFSFSLKKYTKLRAELKCEKAFPHVYEKISKLGRSHTQSRNFDQNGNTNGLQSWLDVTIIVMTVCIDLYLYQQCSDEISGPVIVTLKFIQNE